MEYEVDSSVQFSRSVVSDSLQPHWLQHSRLPCTSPIHGVYSNSSPVSRWCHPTISSVVPFSSCLQSLPASRFFPMSQFFASDGQSIGVSVSASILLMNIQDWFPLGRTGITLLVIHFKYSSVYIFILNSLTLPSFHPSPWATLNSVSKSMSLFLFCKFICIISF